MADTEEYFPRGGTKPTTTYFKQSENFLGAAEKGEKKRKRPKKKSEDDDGYLSDDTTYLEEVDQSYKTCGIFLNYKVVKEGLLMLGRVRQVFETKANISLPCRMNGVVMACHISESYNKLLEDYVNDKVEMVRELPKMFRPGQYVAVKVLEVSENLLTLTMMPQHINCDRKLSDLHKGALLQAAVSSIEDHGFVMDIGISNTRAFLANGDTNPEVELGVGGLSWVTVKSLSTDNNVINLSSKLDALQRAFQRNKAGVTYPGTSVNFTVHKPLDNGIEGYVFEDQLGYIQRHQADSVKGKKPVLGQKIRARLLYSVPPKQIPFFTMRGVFDSSYPDLAIEQFHQEGDIIEDAQVLKTWGRSVLLRLSPGATGALVLRKSSSAGDLADDRELAKSYPIGSTHKVRVLCYGLSDYVYSVSDDPSVLAQSHFTLSQVAVGDLVCGTISEVTDTHLRVSVGRLTAYVPQTHMTETGIYIDPKKASTSKLSKKYKLGQAVRARVLSAGGGRLVASLKPSLLESTLPLLQRYSREDEGHVFTGVVSHIKQYLLVSFFDGVCCYVPARLTGAEPGDLADAFHVGQIVKCTIMSVKPEAKKMTGSLITAAFEPVQDRKKKATKRKNDDKEVLSKKKKSDESNDQINIKDGKHGSDKENDEVQSKEISQKQKKKKKSEKSKINKSDDSKDVTATDTEIIEETDTKRKKKKNKNAESTKDTNHSDETTDVKRKKKEIVSESDEIETDLQNDSELLTPQELSLTDLSDCVTEKHYKKRVVSLLKAIKARTNRMSRVEKKITAIEEKGLTPMNKKFHTAMHLEKLTNEERTKKLMNALKKAQDHLKQLDDKTNSKTESNEVNTEEKEEQKGKKQKEKKRKQMEKKEESKDIKVTSMESLEPVLKVPSAKDFWTLEEKTVTDVRDDSSSSDEEEQEKPKKKRKKLSVAEKVAKAREEEERLREMERRAIESESSPRSSEQFERALLAQPDCSQLWIAYMAFHLQSTEIEKARNVARKALTSISFREEGEKLNVWLALLNIEHRFGTKETQQKTLQDALQTNDTYEVHSKLLDILVETGQRQDLVSLVELMMRKYRRRAQAYSDCGAACYGAGLAEKARQVMQKGIAALEKKEHVSLLVRFSSLERLQGSDGRERSEALLEHALAAYPQRVDVCCVYADMLLRDKDIARARQLMERMTSQNLPARKMKVLYKKWIEVEQKIGDKEHEESVRRSALEFLDKAKFLGQAVRARVLSAGGGRLVASLKPSLLESTLPLLQRYSREDEGHVFTGVVSHIKQYLLVSFFDGVCCYVPARLAGAEPGDLADAFHVGQIVKCTIMSVKPEAKKMTGSLITAAFEPVQDRKKKATKRKNDDKEVLSKKKKSDESNDQINIKDGKHGSDKENDEVQSKEISQKQKKKKKSEKSKINKSDDSKDVTATDTEIIEETDTKRKKKKNKNVESTKDTNHSDETTDVKRKKKEIVSESDEIETDLQNDSELLTPQELSLTDLSDCVTEKHYKKRVVSLLKAIKARTNRMSRVEKKITAIEEKGLTPMNKKFHTAMHLEKLTNEERTKKLMNALKKAQDQLKQLDDKTNSKTESNEVNTEEKEEQKGKKQKEKKRKQMEKKEESKDIKVTSMESLEPVLKVPSAKDFWTLEEKTLTDVRDDSSSSDEEEQEKPKKKRKKLSVAEKVAKAREEEERLREMERRAIESESSPRSSEQFERALLAQPDCSQLWIAYMAFHLQSTEIEKARNVARKALTSISFREEGEKLNVWLALLNIEHRFGSKETQQKTLQDALQTNDTYEVHSKLLDILVETGQRQDLVSLVELMMRKYRRRAQAYSDCGAACYGAGLAEKARQVMQKGIAALEKKEHVSLLVRFSSLERLQGSDGRERSEALLEHALAAYPQRVDVCCVYADMLLRDKDIARARQLMERMTSQNLPARKMKVLYKKWIEVEQKIGDKEHEESVRRSALEFLDKAKF